MNLNLGRHVLFLGRLLPFGVLALLISLDASPFDKTPPQWPQLSTSHGPIKSGGTIKEAIQGSIDLLLTDMPMTDAELQQVHDMRGVRLLHVATAVTAVVPCYNLSGLKAPLNFSADTLAAIFLGKITKWNDPAILALNPSSHLPAADIIVIGHAMEDGSTYAWTDFLSKTNTDWRRSIGRVRSLVALPALARAQTSEDLAELVKHTPNSIRLAGSRIGLATVSTRHPPPLPPLRSRQAQKYATTFERRSRIRKDPMITRLPASLGSSFPTTSEIPRSAP
jgi:hypothetical protein